MKVQILNIDGKKIKEIETGLFEEPIREDLIRKVVEAQRVWQPYSPKYLAGMNRSASGKVRHKRHSWKSDRGRGLSRFPKKTMWRRGTQFSWVGAIIPSTRGGRRAHPPKGFLRIKKINKKELKKAFLSTLSYVSNLEEVKKKYSSLANREIKMNFPLVIDEKIFSLKTKEFFESLSKILGDFYEIAISNRQIRSGRGKSRGRKYKVSSGVIFVVGKNEGKKINGIDVVRVPELKVRDLAENGARLTLFSEKAVVELENFLRRKEKFKDGKDKERKSKVVKKND